MYQNVIRLEHPKGHPTCNIPPLPQQAGLDLSMSPAEETKVLVCP